MVDKILRGKATSHLKPLIPNYVFACFDPEIITYTSIRSTRGIVDFVRHGASPVKIPFELINTLMMKEKALYQSEVLEDQFNEKLHLEKMSQVADAIYKEADGKLRSMLLIDLIQKQTKPCTGNVRLKEI